jgi:hypothetical protein
MTSTVPDALASSRHVNNVIIADRERSYRARRVRAPIAGNVELFG